MCELQEIKHKILLTIYIISSSSGYSSTPSVRQDELGLVCAYDDKLLEICNLVLEVGSYYRVLKKLHNHKKSAYQNIILNHYLVNNKY